MVQWDNDTDPNMMKKLKDMTNINNWKNICFLLFKINNNFSNYLYLLLLLKKISLFFTKKIFGCESAR